MTACENITELLERIAEVTEDGTLYELQKEDVEQLQEALEQVKNIAYEPVLPIVYIETEFKQWLKDNKWTEDEYTMWHSENGGIINSTPVMRERYINEVLLNKC